MRESTFAFPILTLLSTPDLSSQIMTATTAAMKTKKQSQKAQQMYEARRERLRC